MRTHPRYDWTRLSTASGTKIGVNGSLDVKERGLALALEVDVEPQPAAVGTGDQRLAHGLILDGREQRVARVGLLLLREVDPGEEVPQQATGQHDDVDVRRVRRGRPRLDREEPEAAPLVGRAPPEADEALVERQLDPRVRDRLVAEFDLERTEPEWALGYRWDIVLRGRDATPVEG